MSKVFNPFFVAYPVAPVASVVITAANPAPHGPMQQVGVYDI